MSLPAVAKRFPTLCKKCESERYHIVLAHVDADSAKVECEVCHKKSTYSLKAKRQISFEKKKAKMPATIKISQWQELVDAVGGKAEINYNIKSSFKEKQSLQHPKFGLGFVLRSEPKKMDVLFQDGIKTLIQNQ